MSVLYEWFIGALSSSGKQENKSVPCGRFSWGFVDHERGTWRMMVKKTVILVLFWVAAITTTPTVPASAVDEKPIVVMERHAIAEHGNPKGEFYSLEIYADGRVRYRGSKFAVTHGIVEAYITPTNVREILSAFKSVDFWNLPSKWPVHEIPDEIREEVESVLWTSSSSGGVTLTLNEPGRSKSIGYKNGEGHFARFEKNVSGRRPWSQKNSPGIDVVEKEIRRIIKPGRWACGPKQDEFTCSAKEPLE